MNKEEILVKTAERVDLPAVYNLVKELAIFEDEPDAVTAEITDYLKAFDEKLLIIKIAICQNQIIGCTVSYDTFSTWKGKMFYLEDFFVLEQFRSKGVGQMLFDDFILEAKSRECAMVKWQVLDWNVGAIKFYEKNHATIEKEWFNAKIIF